MDGACRRARPCTKKEREELARVGRVGTNKVDVGGKRGLVDRNPVINFRTLQGPSPNEVTPPALFAAARCTVPIYSQGKPSSMCGEMARVRADHPTVDGTPGTGQGAKMLNSAIRWFPLGKPERTPSEFVKTNIANILLRVVRSMTGGRWSLEQRPKLARRLAGEGEDEDSSLGPSASGVRMCQCCANTP